jgi:hypothetical protein
MEMCACVAMFQWTNQGCRSSGSKYISFCIHWSIRIVICPIWLVTSQFGSENLDNDKFAPSAFALHDRTTPPQISFTTTCTGSTMKTSPPST